MGTERSLMLQKTAQLNADKINCLTYF